MRKIRSDRGTGKIKTTSVGVTESQRLRLKSLNAKTKVPVSEYVREGLELILARENSNLPPADKCHVPDSVTGEVCKHWGFSSDNIMCCLIGKHPDSCGGVFIHGLE